MQARSMMIVAAAVLISGVLGAAASADEAPRASYQVGEIKVRLGDLELDRQADAADALDRIEFAAGRACGFEGREVSERRLYRACVEAATAEAVARLDAPLVSALYDESERRGTSFAGSTEEGARAAPNK